MIFQVLKWRETVCDILNEPWKLAGFFYVCLKNKTTTVFK